MYFIFGFFSIYIYTSLYMINAKGGVRLQIECNWCVLKIIFQECSHYFK